MAVTQRTRRSSPRLRRRYKVKLKQTVCFTVDIGRDGFCAEVLRVLVPGTDVEGTMEMGGHEIPFRGRVLWAWAGAPYMGVRGRMGVRFTDT